MSGFEEETYSTIFTSLKHPVRRKILRMLSEKPKTFSEILDVLGISSSHLTYHLENLGELVSKTENGKYKLSTFGEAAVGTMRKVEEMPKVTEPKRMRARAFTPNKRPRKILIAILLIVIVGVGLSWWLLSNFYMLNSAVGEYRRLTDYIVGVRGEGHACTEFYIRGPDRKAEDYPCDVGVGEEYSVYVGVVNHMGGPENYIVYVKFRNQTPPNSKPSPLPPLYEFRFSVADNETWESLLTFEILDTYVEGDSMLVGNISFNGVASSVDSLSMWDSEHDGFYYQLFFELWLYDIASQSFQYHNQFVGIWLHMTSASYIKE